MIHRVVFPAEKVQNKIIAWKKSSVMEENSWELKDLEELGVELN